MPHCKGCRDDNSQKHYIKELVNAGSAVVTKLRMCRESMWGFGLCRSNSDGMIHRGRNEELDASGMLSAKRLLLYSHRQFCSCEWVVPRGYFTA